MKDELEQLNQVLRNKIDSLEVPSNQLPEAAGEARFVTSFKQQFDGLATYRHGLVVYLQCTGSVFSMRAAPVSFRSSKIMCFLLKTF